MYKGLFGWGGIIGWADAVVWPLFGMLHEWLVVKFCDSGKLISNLKPLMKSILPVMTKQGFIRCSKLGTFLAAEGCASDSY